MRLDDCRHGVIERTCTKCSQYTPEQARAHDDLMKANKAYGKPQHTPTPWKVGEKPVEISGTFFEVIGGNGIPTSFLQERVDQDLSDRSAIKNHEADAAFIVRAVNCHEDLVNGLKDAVSDLEAIYAHITQYGGFVVSLGMWRRLDAMKEAIAKAGGL